MIYISHRGNLTGKNEERENSPEYIDEALAAGFDVEIDLWCADGRLYLGHDYPKYKINLDWLISRYLKLWIHCKNVEAVLYMQEQSHLHYFWHEKDLLTLTSLKFIWVYPNHQPIPKSISVLPELHNEDVSQCAGICSDFIQNYLKQN
jgi:hypothetical protein